VRSARLSKHPVDSNTIWSSSGRTKKKRFEEMFRAGCPADLSSSWPSKDDTRAMLKKQIGGAAELVRRLHVLPAQNMPD